MFQLPGVFSDLFGSKQQGQAQPHRMHLVQQLRLCHPHRVGLLCLGAVAVKGLGGGELGHVAAIILDQKKA